jgi:hypothetical protein
MGTHIPALIAALKRCSTQNQIYPHQACEYTFAKFQETPV